MAWQPWKGVGSNEIELQLQAAQLGKSERDQECLAEEMYLIEARREHGARSQFAWSMLSISLLAAILQQFTGGELSQWSEAVLVSSLREILSQAIRNYCILYFLVVAPLLSLMEWWPTLHHFGMPSIARCRNLIRLSLISANARFWRQISGIALLVVNAELLANLTGVERKALILAAGVISVFLLVLDSALPPAVLYLAASGRKTLLLFSRLRDFLPHRVVSLICPAHHSEIIVATEADRDVLRTADETHWQGAVRLLMLEVPIIVLDARQRTPATIEELSLISGLDRQGTVICITNDDGAASLLDVAQATKVTEVPQFVRVTESQLRSTLNEIFAGIAGRGPRIKGR